jgi:hypothetical protein
MENSITLTSFEILSLSANFNKFPDDLKLPSTVRGRVAVLKQKIQKFAKEIEMERMDKYTELSKKSGEIKRGSEEEMELSLYWREVMECRREVTFKSIKFADLGTDVFPQLVIDALLPFLDEV